MQKIILILMLITALTSAVSISRQTPKRKYRGLIQWDPTKEMSEIGGQLPKSMYPRRLPASRLDLLRSQNSQNERYGSYNTPYYNYYNGNPYVEDVYPEYYEEYNYGRPPYYYDESVYYGYNNNNPLIYGYGGIVY